MVRAVPPAAGPKVIIRVASLSSTLFDQLTHGIRLLTRLEFLPHACDGATLLWRVRQLHRQLLTQLGGWINARVMEVLSSYNSLVL